MIYKAMTLQKAYRWVKDKKADIAPNPGFMRQLIALEREVLGAKEPSMDHKQYMVEQLLQVVPQSNTKRVGEVLDQCGGDYVAAQDVLLNECLK